jgi:exodeoxyribonuclease V gamma subunit
VLGRQAVPENSPFDKGRLLWRLMRLLPQVMGAPEYAPLLGFLAADSDRRKRFQLAERLADLFDQYQVYRADWLAAWAAGDDVLIDARGQQTPLADEQRWQAALWRALLADVEAHVDRARAGRVRVGTSAPTPAGQPYMKLFSLAPETGRRARRRPVCRGE